MARLYRIGSPEALARLERAWRPVDVGDMAPADLGRADALCDELPSADGAEVRENGGRLAVFTGMRVGAWYAVEEKTT